MRSVSSRRSLLLGWILDEGKTWRWNDRGATHGNGVRIDDFFRRTQRGLEERWQWSRTVTPPGGSAMINPGKQAKKGHRRSCRKAILLLLMACVYAPALPTAIEYYVVAPGMLLVVLAMATLVGAVLVAAWRIAEKLPSGAKRKLLLGTWASVNILLLCVAVSMGNVAIQLLRDGRDPLHRVVLENSGANILKYPLCLLTLAVLAGALWSSWHLIRRFRSRLPSS